MIYIKQGNSFTRVTKSDKKRKARSKSYFHGKTLCDALRNLVLLVQFKKREKDPWRSVTFSKVTDLSLNLY